MYGADSNIIMQAPQLQHSHIYQQAFSNLDEHYSMDSLVGTSYEYPTQARFISMPAFGLEHTQGGGGDSSGSEGLSGRGEYEFRAFDLRTVTAEAKQARKREESETGSKQTKNGSSLLSLGEVVARTKPELFMGAFTQTQSQFGFFSMNVKVPSLAQFVPFKSILTESARGGGAPEEYLTKSIYESKVISESKLYNANQYVFNRSNISSPKDTCNNKKESKCQPNNKKPDDLFFFDSLQISRVSEILQSPAEPQVEPQQNPSQFFSNYLLNYDPIQQQKRHEFMTRSELWDGSYLHSPFNHAYSFHISRSSPFIQGLQSRLSLSTKVTVFSNQQICRNLANVLLGFENQLFQLDYHCREWQVKHDLNPTFQHSLSSSFQGQLEDVIAVANMKSKLDVALAYVKKQGYRRILQELGMQVHEFLIIVEQIGLELVASRSTYLQFVVAVSQLRPEMSLIYELLINDSLVAAEQKSYMDFDSSFLNSEAVMFRQIVLLSNSNDSLTGKGYEMSLQLLRAVFKPITFALNRIVFEETVEISNRDDTYLRLYFENLKDLLSYLGKRIDLIKNQSNQLYLICRSKENIRIVVETDELQQYTQKWAALFDKKRKMIEGIQRRYRNKIKEQKQKKEEEKIKEIYQLKEKLMKRIEQTKQRKHEVYQQNLKEIKRIKKDILEREERRRLNQLIEKEQEKGFLLDQELKEKAKLIHNKQKLIEQAERQGIKIQKEKLGEEQQKIEHDKVTDETIMKSTLKQQSVIQSSKLQQKEPEPTPTPTSQIQPKTSIQQALPQQGDPKTLPSMQKITSNYSIPSDIKPDPQSQSSSSSQAQPNQPAPYHAHVSTNTVLQLCIDSVIRQQIDITHLALGFLVYDQYQLLHLMEFMRRIFLSGDGEVLSSFLHRSTRRDSRINVGYFSECSLFDNIDEFVRDLEPQFYEMGVGVRKVDSSAGQIEQKSINIFIENLENYIGFQFKKLPVILEPYFSYIHLGKYMQIFSFIVKIKHSGQLISDCLLSLNQNKKQLQADEDNHSLMKKLYLTRHMIQLFLNTLQSYLFYRVIEKEIKIIRNRLSKKDINELSILHLNMLDSIIMRALIENPSEACKKIKSLFIEIREFKNIVQSFCANDIHSYIRESIESKVDKLYMLFRDHHRLLENMFYHL